MKTIREQAAELSYSLGIPMYVREGNIFTRPPGDRFDPPDNAHPHPHGPTEPPKEAP